MDHVVDHGQSVIEKGSKSFAAAARLFDEETRGRAYMLYAWCRHCDDLVDDQVLGHAPSHDMPSRDAARDIVERLEQQTRAALSGQPSEPAFEALQEVGSPTRQPPALEALDEVHLPQRPGAVEWSTDDASHEPTELVAPARRRHRHAVH